MVEEQQCGLLEMDFEVELQLLERFQVPDFDSDTEVYKFSVTNQ